MKTEIRVAKPGDAASACTVLRRSIAECCAEDHRNDAAILSAWLGNKTPETVKSWFLSPSNFSLVAITANEVVGVAMLTRAGKIVLFYVSPDVRFSGVGKALLQGLEAQAGEWGLRAIQVDSTATAQPFYLRNEFVAGTEKTSCFGIPVTSYSKKLAAGSYAKAAPCRCGKVEAES
jgi:GNAT superfamily N-acetyltransferase